MTEHEGARNNKAPEWMRPAGVAALSLGALGFVASAAVGGGPSLGGAIVAGLLNPLFFIGVPLGLYWLHRAQEGRYQKPLLRPPVPQLPSLPSPPSRYTEADEPVLVNKAPAKQPPPTWPTIPPELDAPGASSALRSNTMIALLLGIVIGIEVGIAIGATLFAPRGETNALAGIPSAVSAPRANPKSDSPAQGAPPRSSFKSPPDGELAKEPEQPAPLPQFESPPDGEAAQPPEQRSPRPAENNRTISPDSSRTGGNDPLPTLPVVGERELATLGLTPFARPNVHRPRWDDFQGGVHGTITMVSQEQNGLYCAARFLRSVAGAKVDHVPVFRRSANSREVPQWIGNMTGLHATGYIIAGRCDGFVPMDGDLVALHADGFDR